MLSNGLEVPTVVEAGLKSRSLSSDAHSSYTRSANIPLFDEEDYDNWVIPRIAANLMASYEAFVGKVPNGMWRDLLIAKLEMQAHDLVHPNMNKLNWEPVTKTKKKSVKFFQDVPYKHSKKTGEIFEGPISSQKTYEKEMGEHMLVFVNPEVYT